MSSDQSWTVGRLLQWTTDYFKKNGFSTPRLEAEVLLAEAKGCQRIELYTTYDEEADESSRTRFRELVRRRAAGEPVAYLVGHREFYSLPFTVTPDVLIPRPETEILVMQLLEAAKDRDAAATLEIADVGTGSGVIALSVAKHLPGCRVTGIDSSLAALNVARRNSDQLGVGNRVEFVQGDLLANLPTSQQFDIVASNPPYVSQSEFESLSGEVKNYEPRCALLAGSTGTEVIERLIPQAAERLRPHGILFLEISPMIEQSVVALLGTESRFETATVTKDLTGLPRVVSAFRA
jgi:release factor glutamine methyltransferase